MAIRIREDYRGLSGAEKAAVFMLSLDDEHAAKLFSFMDEEEIREISLTMANLGKVTSTVIERLLLEFAEQVSHTGSLVGSLESTERLLLKFMDTGKVGQIMDDIRGPAGRTMWDKLGNVNETVLANYLKNEYPQTVAVVMTKIRPEHAAGVLALLPETFAMEVIMRMLRLEPVQKEVLDDVEKTLRTEFMSNIARTTRRDSHEMMAEIFNNLDRQVESRFFVALEERNRDSAEKIKSLMFTFEDMLKLDQNSVQVVLRSIDRTKLPTALKGASEPLRDLFFSNMPERAAKILREDMAAMGPVRLKDVDEAQQSIIVTTKELQARGEIVSCRWPWRRRAGVLMTIPAHPSSMAQALSSVQKFQFDDFDMEQDNSGVAGINGVTPPPPNFSLEEINAARLEAEREGRERAIQDVSDSLEAQAVGLMNDIRDQASALMAEQQRQADFITAEAVRLAAMITRKVLPVFAETQTAREIEALIATCFKERPEETRLVIRLHDSLLDPIQARMERMVKESGFAGKPILLADPSLARTEARVEWANGGTDWNFQAQLDEIENTARNISSVKTMKPRAKTTPTPELPAEADIAIEETGL